MSNPLHIMLVGQVATAGLRRATGLALEGAPNGTSHSPLAGLAAQLLQLGQAVHVVTLDRAIAAPLTIGEGGLKVTYCPVRAPPNFRPRERVLDLGEREIAYLTQAIRSGEADVVHAHWTYDYAEAAVRSGLPHLVTLRDLGFSVLWHLRHPYWFGRLLMKLRLMWRIRHLVGVSPYVAERAWHYGHWRKVGVVPNGVDLPKLDDAVVAGKSLERPILVTIGDSARLKNVMASVAAFRHIRRAVPTAELHLFGGGLDASFADDEGVVCHGQTPHAELMTFLETRATLLIHPSRTESFGMIIAEAKARCVPVVAGRHSGGVPYVCGEREGGCVLVDIEQPEAIARAVLAIVGDEEEYRRMATMARLDIEARFEAGAVARAYLDHYRRIVGEGRAERPASASMATAELAVQ